MLELERLFQERLFQEREKLKRELLQPKQPDSEAIKSSHGGIESLISPSDCIITQVLLGAEDAMKHVKACERNIKTTLSRRLILEGSYYIQVGFNESLITFGVGHLQEIYLFFSEDLPANDVDSLGCELGKMFSPYPGVLFMPSASYRTPVFNTHGSIWDFHDLVLTRTERYVDNTPFSLMTSGSVISHARNAMNTVPEGSSSVGCIGTGRGQEAQKGARYNSQDGERGSKDQVPQRDDPGEGSGSGPGLPVGNIGMDLSSSQAGFEVLAKIYSRDTHPTVLQEFNVHCTTDPAIPALEKYPTSHVTFKEVKTQGRSTVGFVGYKNFHVRVAVGTTHECTKIKVKQPFPTPAAAEKITLTKGRKTAGTGILGVTLAGILGIPTISTTATASGTMESSSTSESKKFNSRITQDDSQGVVWWGFYVSDDHKLEKGFSLGEIDGNLPDVDLEFLQADKGPPPPPSNIFVEVASYWSLPPRWLPEPRLEYKNLGQFVVLEMPTKSFERSEYKAVLDVRSGRPIEREEVSLQGSLKVVPAVLLVGDPNKSPMQKRRLCDESLLDLPMFQRQRQGGMSIPPALGCAPSPSSPITISLNKRNELLALLASDDSATGSGNVPTIRVRRLANIGNMCYANSVLQVLIYCPLFRRLFSELGGILGYRGGVRTQLDGTPLVNATIRLLKEFEGGIGSESGPKSGEDKAVKMGKGKGVDRKGSQPEGQEPDPFIPSCVYDVMTQKGFDDIQGGTGHQQDAEEFLGFYLDTLEEELLSVVRSISSKARPGSIQVGVVAPQPPFEGHKQDGPSAITRIFGGTLQSTLRMDGQEDSVKFESWRSLKLDIQSEHILTIQDALAYIFRPQVVDVSSPTRASGVTVQTTSIQELPPILVLHMKRFTYDAGRGRAVKVGKQVRFGPELEMGAYISARQAKAPPTRYKLFGVLNHHGLSADGGHYTLDVLHPNQSHASLWVRIDNDLVSEVESKDVFGGRDDRCAYLLFYQEIIAAG